MTAAPFNMVAIKMSWPGQSTKDTCLRERKQCVKNKTPHPRTCGAFIFASAVSPDQFKAALGTRDI